ncbi:MULTISPECIES: pyridoxal kinase PdxY [unclassified Roseitalea]|uniref:pyridoxal kinase PdxY n=1 Tax=unclassified Roseitalea TaxID=2639107 RepID=UPI00273EB004|nr:MULTISPECIES: pyridoxal kinase PdxY [unclassified Roseitalea]
MTAEIAGGTGAVAVISSHVARGAVGNRAAVFALETLGFPVIAVPTVLLPWHPGHGAATRIVHDDAVFGRFMADLTGGPFAGEIGAVLSGYLGSARQAEIVAEAVQTLRAANPALLFVCDPVIGDENGLYVPEAVARAIGDRLVPIADIATPNRFELAWLTGRAIATNAQIVDAARALGPTQVLVTSAHAEAAGHMSNLLVARSGVIEASHAAIDTVPNGTGDLTAALFLARRLAGYRDPEALRLATASVHDLLLRTALRGADELTLAADAAVIATPSAQVAVRSMPDGQREAAGSR